MKHFIVLLLWITILVSVCCLCTMNVADTGGGVIVTGKVIDGDKKAVPGAIVVRAPKGAVAGVDTTVTIDDGPFTYEVKVIPFEKDTCDASGTFSFEDVYAGEYTIVAYDGILLGINCFTVTERETTVIDPLTIGYPAKLTVKPYYQITVDSLKYCKAQIAGTNITALADSNGSFEFKAVPEGVLEVALIRNNYKVERMSGFQTEALHASQLMYDPVRSSEYWTAKDRFRDNTERPYVYWSSPQNGAKGITGLPGKNATYDIAIQFSTAMDTRLTSSSISVHSTDSSTTIDSLWWVNEMAFINLRTMYGTKEIFEGDSLYKEHVIYSVEVDTLATSLYGLKFAYPETITFTPRP